MTKLSAEGIARANRRAEKLRDALEKTRPGVIHTRHGKVQLDRVSITEQDGLKVVEVLTGAGTESGDVHFRVIAPKLLVEDPAGSRERAGVRYRIDPVHALAETIALHGGAQRKARGR